MPKAKRNRDVFNSIAQASAHFLGSATALFLAYLVVVVWAITGPIFKFSDTWQLEIEAALNCQLRFQYPTRLQSVCFVETLDAVLSESVCQVPTTNGSFHWLCGMESAKRILGRILRERDTP
jgi:low affinity Fe/Cu permease